MDLAQISHVDSTYQDKQTGLRIRFIAPSKLKLLSIKRKVKSDTQKIQKVKLPHLSGPS